MEITPEQHRALSTLAHRRHLRGFANLVQEALDAYLADLGSDEVDVLLGLEGALTTAEADQFQGRIDEVRSTWRAS